MPNNLKQLFSSHFTWLFIVLVAAFWQVAFLYSGFHWDMLDVHLPWLTYMSEVLQSGELHYWNPYQELGYPFHADMMSTWYPPALITARFIGFNLIVLQYYFLVHLFAAGCGMYKLVSFFNADKRMAFLGAVSYMLCGLSVSNAQHLFIITSLVWIPFVLYYFLKVKTSLSITDVLKLSLVTCFMITGGYPFLTVVTLYFLLILLLLAVFRSIKYDRKSIPKMLLLFLIAAVLTVFMCAPMIISLVQVMPEMGRGTALSVETAISYPYTLHALWLSLIPFSLGNNWEFFKTDISMVNIYFGIILSIFLLYGLLKKAPASFMEYVFFGFGIICLLGALALELPVMKWMVAVIPLFNFFRFPALFRLFFIIGSIVFAAAGLRHFLNSFEKDKKHLRYYIFLFIGMIVILILYGLSKTDIHHLTFNKPYTSLQDILMGLTVHERIVIGGLVQLCILLAFLFVLQKAKSKQSFLRNTTILIILDMFISVQANMNYTVVDPVVDPVATTKALNTLPKGFPIPKRTSMLNARNEGTGVLGIWRNVNIFTKEPAVDAFTSFYLNDYLLLEKDTLLGKKVLDNPVVYLSSSVFSMDDLVKRKKEDSVQKKDIYVAGTEYNQLKDRRLVHSKTDTAYFLQFGPNRFKIKVSASGEQILTLLQSAYKGWHVSVAGKEASWFKSNYLFMSVLIPQGQYEVDFSYENKWVKNGFISAATVFLFVLGAILISVFRNRKNKGNNKEINLPEGSL